MEPSFHSEGCSGPDPEPEPVSCALLLGALLLRLVVAMVESTLTLKRCAVQLLLNQTI